MNPLPHPQPSPKSGRVAGTPIRLVSLNTWKCDGHSPQRLQAMATQLQVLGMGMGRVLAPAPARDKRRECGGVRELQCKPSS